MGYADQSAALEELQRKAAAYDRLRAWLDSFEAETRALPAQHEIKEKGCSTYNWNMTFIRIIRPLLKL